MIISPFTPLNFRERRSDGSASRYVQTFGSSDMILLEVLGTASEDITAAVYDAETGMKLYDIVWNEWQINTQDHLRFTSISLCPGYYSVYVSGAGYSEPFRVTDDERELEETVLIQYSMRNNRQRRDVLFFIDGMQYFFDFRVPGGFKDSQWAFSVESEQFVTPEADIAQLYGLESTQKKFTLGSAMGVPVWFGEMLNRILVCSHVYFDGIKYCRKEASVPEMTQAASGVDSFIFNQNLQQSVNLDPVIEQRNRVLMRRVDATNYRTTGPNNRIII